jgi:hypothetical protein
VENTGVEPVTFPTCRRDALLFFDELLNEGFAFLFLDGSFSSHRFSPCWESFLMDKYPVLGFFSGFAA